MIVHLMILSYFLFFFTNQQFEATVIDISDLILMVFAHHIELVYQVLFDGDKVSLRINVLVGRSRLFCRSCNSKVGVNLLLALALKLRNLDCCS